jgi:hypothetical protein
LKGLGLGLRYTIESTLGQPGPSAGRKALPECLFCENRRWAKLRSCSSAPPCHLQPKKVAITALSKSRRKGSDTLFAHAPRTHPPKMSASLIGHGSQAPFAASLASSPRGSRFFPWSASDRVRLPQALVGRDGEPRFGARLRALIRSSLCFVHRGHQRPRLNRELDPNSDQSPITNALGQKRTPLTWLR